MLETKEEKIKFILMKAFSHGRDYQQTIEGDSSQEVIRHFNNWADSVADDPESAFDSDMVF